MKNFNQKLKINCIGGKYHDKDPNVLINRSIENRT
jgi:hypothetical protein